MQNVSMKPEVRNFILNDSLISPPLIEQNLDVLDNVACAWLSLVGPIKWDIFVGFKNENDMVDFVLNKAASRNITVFASTSRERLERFVPKVTPLSVILVYCFGSNVGSI